MSDTRQPECAEPRLAADIGSVAELAARHEERRRLLHYQDMLADAQQLQDDEGTVMQAAANLVAAADRFRELDYEPADPHDHDPGDPIERGLDEHRAAEWHPAYPDLFDRALGEGRR